MLLTVNDGNPNAASVRFLIDGAPVPADAQTYQRIVLVFNGDDEDAVAAARALERGQGQGLRDDLLAAGRAGALGKKSVSRPSRYLTLIL